MNLTFYIPDEIAGSLETEGDLSRRALEAFAIEEYKSERFSKAQLRRLLRFETVFELDDFLKEHQVPSPVTAEDVRRDLRDLRSLGL
jgi:hypothetical protein